ncbi:MAG: methylenetetrahydrofolate reductase, partial [Alistipes sp.]
DALIDMDFLGLHNVLALRGDKLQTEQCFVPHPQGHLHAEDLVRQIAAMNRGEFVDGEVEQCHHSRFSIGVAGYPEIHSEASDADTDLLHLKAKVEAGAEYITTQLFFNNRHYFDFVERCHKAGINVPIIPGIKPISTLQHLTVLPRIFHIEIPDALRREAEAHPNQVRDVGVAWATMQARELQAAGVPVIHLYTMGRTDNIQKIAQAVF